MAQDQETYPSRDGSSTPDWSKGRRGTDGVVGRTDRVDAPSTARPVRGTLGLDMALIDIEEAARRLARAIASDLSLYHADKVERGIAHDNLFDELAGDIEEGRALYNSRVSPDLFSKNFYDRAIIDLLIRGKGHIRSKMW